MTNFISGLSIGFYLLGALVTFLAVGFLCMLGGNSADLWKPFVYALLWPLVWLYAGYQLLR